MTKNLIIIALIIVIIYLYYQQKQTNNDNHQSMITQEVIYDVEQELLVNQLADLTTEINSYKLAKQDLLKTISQKEESLLAIENNQQEQLKKISLLFNQQTETDENVKFADLYSHLQSIAERTESINIPPLSHKERRKLKKQK
ncbi:MAG: hypothetical protein GBAus27B_000200 [Mycoplasmataceae bacterium]|nr:MAG: hypothetical protein GBAus27B_000200 [Mycoplasmataceae bacterium]